MYLSGKGAHKIALTLNQNGIETKKQTAWMGNTVRQMLRNPIYKGTMRYNYRVNKENYFEVDDVAPVIIDKETFEKVQAIIDKRKTSHPRRATSEYMFSGTAVCKRCGGNMVGKQGSSKRGDKVYYTRSYYCVNRQKGICDQNVISQNYIEAQFLEKIDTLLVEDTHIDIQERPDHSQDTIEYINKELKAIENRRKKWQYAWANDKINDQDFTERMNEEKEKEERLLEELKEVKPPDKQLSLDEQKEILKNIKLLWNNLTPIEKKNFLQLFVKKIEIDKISPKQKASSISVDIEF